jgi:hypothetical protein
MVANQETQTPEFAGTKKFQVLATRAFDVLRSQGMFMSDNSPIRVTVESLTAFLVEHEGAKPNEVARIIEENPAVFATETIDDVAFVLTTRAGQAPVPNSYPSTHSLAARFLTPEPKPERPVRPAPERVRVDPNWATYSVPDFGDEDEDAYLDEPEPDEEVVVVVEPVDVAEEVVAETPEPIVEEAVVVDDVAPVVAEEVAPEPAAIATPAVSDFSTADDAGLASAIASSLADDARIASFAGQWMAEERVARLGRNDIRRIKDYITEQEQPLTDGTLAQDILNVRPNSADFNAVQFAVNFRLSREHKDFDFVGTNDQRFWSTSSLPQIGTTRRKPNEIGTDYRFLVDEVPAEVEHRSTSSVSHVLSFYEFSLGLLPYNLDMQQLLPKQVLPEQRSAVLTFEIPQSYTTYLVELRFPTPNRGGFLLGLDDFYADSLVPGALISISATDNDGHYKVEFLPGANQNARLLDLDDRRSPRYHFRPTTFACEVSPEWLISEDRFPKLGSEKPLDDKIRRRPDAVVEATFERIGIEDGDSFISTFDELLAAVNIERPISESLLRATLEQDNKVTSDDADTFTYVAG